MEKNNKGLSQVLCIACLVLLSGCAYQDYIETLPEEIQAQEMQDLSASEEDQTMSDDQNKQPKEHTQKQPKDKSSSTESSIAESVSEEPISEEAIFEETVTQEQLSSQTKKKEKKEKKVSTSAPISEQTGASEKQETQDAKKDNKASGQDEPNRSTDNALTEQYPTHNSMQEIDSKEIKPIPPNSRAAYEEKVLDKTDNTENLADKVSDLEDIPLQKSSPIIDKEKDKPHSFLEKSIIKEPHSTKLIEIDEGEGGFIDYQGRVTDKRTKRFWNLQRPTK